MNTVWWTAQELAMQTLPGLPSSKRKINEMAAQQGWGERTNATGVRLARPRKGRGGGLEYHYTVLPVPAVAALAARGLVMNQGAQAIVVPASEAWAAFDALPDDKKAKARFRLDVLREIEALRTAGASPKRRAAAIRRMKSEGATNAAIAKTLGIHLRTVEVRHQRDRERGLTARDDDTPDLFDR